MTKVKKEKIIGITILIAVLVAGTILTLMACNGTYIPLVSRMWGWSISNGWHYAEIALAWIFTAWSIRFIIKYPE